VNSYSGERSHVEDITFGGIWEDSWKDHFKSELLLFEAKGGSAKVLYNGGGWQSRHQIMINAVKESVRMRPVKSTKRFYLFTGDKFPATRLGTEWRLLTTVGSRNDTDIVIPDAYSFSWPEIGVSNFEIYNREMIQRSDEYTNSESVVRKAYWKGMLSQNTIRSQFCDYVKGLEKFDVTDSSVGTFREMKESGEFAVLVDLPGQGYSARLKHLLLSKRPVVVYPREQWDWVTLRLEPNVHFPLSLSSIDHFVHMCNIFIENQSASSYYANTSINATANLMRQETLYGAISDAIERCD